LHYLDLPGADAVVPVPVHKNRLRQREFNQSALLARHLAKKLQIELILDCLVKIKDTLPQVGLRSRERNENIKRSFSVRNKDLIAGKKVLLLDDVITTGATVRECSKVLKKAGAEGIYVIALAHGIQE
jgi:ComF family protein